MFTHTVKYVPEWFPGAGFKKFAREAKKNLDGSIDPPFQYVKEALEVREPPVDPPRSNSLLERTTDGNPYHFVNCGDLFRGATGACRTGG